jgi:hypothetical protein
MTEDKEIKSVLRELRKRIDTAELQVERLLIVNRKILGRYRDIVDTKKHYMKHRAPGVLKRQSIMLRQMKMLANKLSAIPRIQLQVTHKARNAGSINTLLMVNHNQARKLRALADMDLRPILNSKANRTDDRQSIRKSLSSYAKRTMKTQQKQDINRIANVLEEKANGRDKGADQKL